jgi:hypothetical protein
MAEPGRASRGGRGRMERAVYFLGRDLKLAIRTRAQQDQVAEAEVVRRALAAYVEAGGLARPGDDELKAMIRGVVREELAARRGQPSAAGRRIRKKKSKPRKRAGKRRRR